jgi:DNA repair protein RadC
LRLSAAASVNHASQKGGNLNYVFGQESKEGRRVQPPLPMKGVFLINNSAFSQQNFAKMSQKKSTLFEVSEVKLTYRNKVKLANSPQIRSSADAHEVLSQNWSDDLELVESFNVLFLNRANKVKGMFQVSKGGVAGTVVDAKIIFAAALKAMACSVILAHNHPSGNTRPSQADLEITRKLKEGGKLLDILILDHLILTPEGYFSFADDGLL